MTKRDQDVERGTFALPKEPEPGGRHIEVDAGELGLMLLDALDECLT